MKHARAGNLAAQLLADIRLQDAIEHALSIHINAAVDPFCPKSGTIGADAMGSVVAKGASDAAARMVARAAQVIARDRCAVARDLRHRPALEQIVEADHRCMRNTAAGDVVAAFQIERGDDTTAKDVLAHVRCVAEIHLHHPIRPLFLELGPTAAR